jgi:hypothetical protein
VATWIVHLRLAENLVARIPDLDAEAFALGNVAPDSGIPDENWENFDPPPQVSHFQVPDQERWGIADIDFFQSYLSPDRQGEENVKRFSFLLGYFFHLVTDNLWTDQIGRPTMEKFKREFDADPKFIWQVKRDWYGLDLEHVRQNPGSIFWKTFIKTEYDEDYLDFMQQEAVQQRIQHIKELYQRTDDEIEEWYGRRPNKYLTEEAMDNFIDLAIEILNEIYVTLFIQNRDPTGLTSALELVTIKRIEEIFPENN